MKDYDYSSFTAYWASIARVDNCTMYEAFVAAVFGYILYLMSRNK